MMERMMVYPFDIEFSPVLRHKSLLEKYNISAVISPKGWSLGGKDANVVDGGCLTGILVSDDFESELKSCDAVLFSDYCKPLDFGKSVLPKIISSIEHKRNIVCTLPLEEQHIKLITDLCQKNGVYFKYYRIETNLLSRVNEQIIIDINTPIVCITGICERTNKFNVQLAIREKFVREGYKVSQVGTKSWCELLGFHSFPSFMYSDSVLESDKVVMFNQYIKTIEYDEKPDVIILGIPGGTIPFNNYLTNRFGLLAYMVSQAILPDSVIFCTLYEELKSNYYEELAESVKYKFGFEIDAYSISNNKFDWNSYMGQPPIAKKFEFLTVSSMDVDSKINSLKDCNIQLYNIFNKDSVSKLPECIIDKLAEYGAVTSL